MKADTDGAFDDLDIQQVVRIIETLDRSSFDALELDNGRYRLTLGKGSASLEPLTVTQQPSGFRKKSTSPPMTIPAGLSAPAISAPAPSAPQPAVQSADVTSDTMEVRSPIMGMFYSKPDPGSPPFVSLGSEVEESATVCLVEVMKIFNAVVAGYRGVIVEICVQDGETIESGQVLFRMRPSSP